MNFDELRLKALGFNTVSDLMDHYENVVVGLIAMQDIAVRNAHKAVLAVDSKDYSSYDRMTTVATTSMNTINSMHQHIADLLTRKQ